MEIFIGKGVGKYIESKLFSAKTYALICTPSISYDLGMKMLKMAETGVKIKVIVSNNDAGETYKVHETVKEFLKSSDNLEYKIVDYKEIFVHAKVYVKDGRYAVVGSPNFTKNSFWNNAESIVIFDVLEDVQKVEKEFYKLWNTYNSCDFITKKKSKFRKSLGKVKMRLIK